MMTEKGKAVTEADALRRLQTLCAKSEHSSGEMLDKMRRWQLPEEAQARVMETLFAGRYIDDQRFTEAFVHDKVAFNGWGRRKIEQALWQKRVDERVARAVLDGVDDEEYLRALRPLLRQKYRSVKVGSDYERSMKLIQYALSRGFTIDLVRQGVDELTRELAEEGEEIGDFCDF